jgi:hypothetical protein
MSHLDEGTLHAWLDGALPPDESARIEAHVAECATCAAAAADARGVIAASSRILSALDDVPGDVIPAGAGGAEVRSLAELRAARSRQRTTRWARRFAPIAAVLAFVAVGIVVARHPRAAMDSAARTTLTTAPAAAPELSPQRPPAAADARAAGPVEPPVMPDSAARVMGRVGASRESSGGEMRRDAPREQAAGAPASDELQKSAVESERASSFAADSVRANEAAAGAPSAPAAAPPRAMMRIRGANSIAGAIGADIRGRVTDERGAPIPLAQVTVDGTTAGSMTAEDGSFELKDVPAGTRTLSARRLGYVPAERKVEAQAGQDAEVDLTLSERALALAEVRAGANTAPVPTRRIAGLTLVSGIDTTVEDRPARRSRYRLSSGEEITLLEVQSAPAGERQEASGKASGKASADVAAAQRTMQAKARAAPMNTLWWTTADGTEITLSGPVPVEELERIRRALAP